MDDPNYEVLVTLLKESHKENKDDLKHLRDSTHGIRNELANISGQMQLLGQRAKTDKEESDKSFQRIHNRVDVESESIKELSKIVGDVVPKVNRITTVFDWAMKGIVTALVGGLMYAMSLMITK